MKKVVLSVFILSVLVLAVTAVQGADFDGLSMNMGNLSRLSNAVTRSISPENFTGEKGKGGMATIGEGNASNAASSLCPPRLTKRSWSGSTSRALAIS